jgi:hypothetical protein
MNEKSDNQTFQEDGTGTNRGAAYLFVLQPYQVHLPLVLRN